MKKISVIAAMIIIVVVSMMAGCNPASVDLGSDGPDEPAVDMVNTTGSGSTEPSGTDEYYTVGIVMSFSEGSVTVLTGDIAEDFSIDDSNAQQFYVGETVGVKENGGAFVLERFEEGDPSIRFTNEGYRIITVKGTVKEASGNTLVVNTGEAELKFDTYENLEISAGADVMVDYFEYEPDSDEKIFLAVYDETSKISLTIASVQRTNTGFIQIEAADDENLEYVVYSIPDTVLNCSYAELTEGTKITVYPDVIREIYPTEVDAKMIVK